MLKNSQDLGSDTRIELDDRRVLNLERGLLPAEALTKRDRPKKMRAYSLSKRSYAILARLVGDDRRKTAFSDQLEILVAKYGPMELAARIEEAESKKTAP